MNNKNDIPKYLSDLSAEELELIVQYRIEQMKKISPEEWAFLRKEAEEILNNQKIK